MMLFGPGIEKLRSEKRKTKTRRKGESYHHVEMFFYILNEVEKRIKGFYPIANECANTDKTSVSCQFGKRIKVFSSSQPHLRVRMRQSDEDIAVQVHNVARNVQNASRIVQRVATVIKNQRTVNSILINLHPVRSASVTVQKRTSLPSRAPVEHLTVGENLAERRN